MNTSPIITVRWLLLTFTNCIVSCAIAEDSLPLAGWNTSRLIGSPEPPLPYTVEKTFSSVPFRSPIYIAEEPGDEFLVVIQEKLPLLAFLNDRDATESVTFAEFPGWLVYSVVFDPEYAKNGYVYAFMRGKTGHDPAGDRVARYTVRKDPTPRIDPTTELRILEWRSMGHDGGDMAFGKDGMLYITTGDGTSDSDGWVSGQTLDDLLGSLLRIDVRGATSDRPYAIPPDNPFLDVTDARGEIWAYGLRNPWRMGIDPVSGQVWVGNNGQDLWETAHLVQRGDNYGWSVYEGSHPFYPNRKLGPTPLVAPTIEHHHSEFRSLTGGVVYRGAGLSDLDGVYVYGDYSTGRIWGAKHDGEQMKWHRELADTQLAIASFTTVTGGDLLITDHLGHAIYRLVKNDVSSAPPAAAFPLKLSDTGLFRSLAQAKSEPQPGVYAYSVNAPAWNDGANAQRWMAVPDGQTIGYENRSPWTFPDGTALVQTLSLDDAVPIETRILLLQQGEWAGYSYRWNEERSDADLVPKGGADAPLPDGRNWHFPSRTECAVCHNRAVNYVLGIQGSQLNRLNKDGKNQLEALADSGILTGYNGDRAPEPWPDPYDTSGDLEARARTYLHVNCSICHVESGGGNAKMDLRREARSSRMSVFDARPQHSTFGLNNAMLVAPSAPERSVLAHRIAQRGSGTGQMPPLCTSAVDEEAVTLIREWIAQMPSTTKTVKAWRADDFLAELPNLDRGRSFLRGKEAFTRTGCVECHRFAGQGGSVGPDLTGTARIPETKALLEAILEPSRVIAEGFAIPGTDPPISLMPAGMVNVLEKDEVLNLLYYLKRDGRPKIAAIVTEYRHNSHADVIVGRLLQTDTLDGKGAESPLELVSLYTDQVPDSDTSRKLAAEHQFPIFPTIAETLTLGTGELAVDGVLLIAEHGNYPFSKTGAHIYPKRRFWEETLAVFKSSGRAVPVFIDKHLADNWDDASFIYKSAAEIEAPLMAGSSLPTTWRRPAADVSSRRADLKEIVALTYHTTDAYGFHALEFVQALAEQRRGGETGIIAVQSTAGEEVWRAFDEKRFDVSLFDAAWSRLSSPGDLESLREKVAEPRLFTIEYADGLRAHLLELNGALNEWTATWRYQNDRVQSSLFWTQEGRPAMHFTWLLNGIEKMMLTGKPTWNVERTLLTSGTLDALLQSLKKGGVRLETPYLTVPYKPIWRWREPPPPPPMRPWSGQ